MGDYFLEYELDEEGTVIGRSIVADDNEWDGDDSMAALAEDHYFNNTIEGLRQDRDVYKAKVEALQEKFVATDAILRNMKMSEDDNAKLKELGWMYEIMF